MSRSDASTAVRWSTSATIGVTTLLATTGAAALVRIFFSPPTPLPDRLAVIPDDAVEIDNDGLYADFAWWHDLNPLRQANAARVPFFMRTIRAHYDSAGLHELTILDLGCGGGLVTEEMALQCKAKFIGVDLSKESIVEAKKHADTTAAPAERLSYLVGSAYDLPLDASSVDAVVCSDVFEHLHDLTKAMSEIARVLRPGGLLVYDTINRTVLSYYLTIVIAQDCLRYVPNHAHDWRLYVKPGEMQSLVERAGLRHSPIKSIQGMRPTLAAPWTIARRLTHGAGTWALLDRWSTTFLIQASYLASATKPKD